MEILIEIIGAVLEELFGLTLESERVPKIAKTVLISLVCLPLGVIGLLFVISGLCKGEAGIAVGGGMIAAFMLTGFAVLLRRNWKK